MTATLDTLGSRGEIAPTDFRFERSGGLVLERYADGRPKRWRCGQDAENQPLDPPEVDRREVLHRLNADGAWEGVNPADQDLAEIKDWRSDWNDPA